MTSRRRRATVLLLATLMGGGCRKHLHPSQPEPIPYPAPIVTNAELDAAMQSVYHFARLARVEAKVHGPKRRPLLNVLALDEAIAILMRDRSPEAHRWRQRAVVILAASSIERFRPILLALGAPVPQLEMLADTTCEADDHWALYTMRANISLIYPLSLFLDAARAATATGTPAPNPESSCTVEVVAKCHYLCSAQGVPNSGCTPPQAWTPGTTWIQAEFSFTVNHSPSDLARILDPQNWDTCNPDLFPAAHVLPSVPNRYPATCADVETDPTPGKPYPYGSKWADVLYEYFDVKAVWFKNLLRIKVTDATSTDYKYTYDLADSICSKFSYSIEEGGLDVDEGEVEVKGTDVSSVVRGLKKLSFTKRSEPAAPEGDEIDDFIYDLGVLDEMGDVLADIVCSCVP